MASSPHLKKDLTETVIKFPHPEEEFDFFVCFWRCCTTPGRRHVLRIHIDIARWRGVVGRVNSSLFVST